MPSEIFKKALQKVPKETKIFVGKSMDVVERIYEIMETKGLNQKDLAKLLGKSPSEINKWLTGSHNFTLKSIAKLEAVLEDDVIQIASKQKIVEPLMSAENVQITFRVKKIGNHGLIISDNPIHISKNAMIAFSDKNMHYPFLSDTNADAFDAHQQTVFIHQKEVEHETEI